MPVHLAHLGQMLWSPGGRLFFGVLVLSSGPRGAQQPALLCSALHAGGGVNSSLGA